MKTGKTIKVALDVLLTLMIVFEMLIQYTGNFLHEVIGLVFFITVVAHLVLSAAWMKGTAHMAKRGKLGGRQIALAVMGCLLAIDMVVLGVSSVAISNVLYSAGFVWIFGSYALWTAVHTASSYLLCVLIVVHLAMHWAFLASAFKIPYDPSRRQVIGMGVRTVAAVGAIALGVTAANRVVPQALALGETLDEGSGASSDADEKSFAGTVSDSAVPSESSSGRGSKGPKDFSEASPGASSGSAPASEPESDVSDGGSSSVSGICTLCRKRCPLSDPQCDKPYRAGLL